MKLNVFIETFLYLQP